MSNAVEADLPGALDAAASGDQRAFAAIVAAHDGDMARVAYLVCGDIGLAHEAVQSAWSVAWRKLGSLRDETRLRPWLLTVAANEARQSMRRRRRLRLVEVPMDEIGERADVAASMAPGHRDLDLHAALARLSSEDRMIVAMRYALGLTSAEIGREIGLTAPSVRSRLSRLMAVLRRELGDD